MKPSAGAAAARITLGLAFFLVPRSPAFPWNPPTKPEVHVTTNLVQIGVIVRDRNGPVTDLTVNDFKVLDRGQPRNISAFSNPTDRISAVRLRVAAEPFLRFRRNMGARNSEASPSSCSTT